MTRFGVCTHPNLTDHYYGRCVQLSRNTTTFNVALSTSKLEAAEHDLGATCSAIGLSAWAQMRLVPPLGVLALPESHHK